MHVMGVIAAAASATQKEAYRGYVKMMINAPPICQLTALGHAVGLRSTLGAAASHWRNSIAFALPTAPVATHCVASAVEYARRTTAKGRARVPRAPIVPECAGVQRRTPVAGEWRRLLGAHEQTHYIITHTRTHARLHGFHTRFHVCNM